ncbi:MAG: hypothetical protein ACREKR_03040 [Candidatus Methylomirabilales bacterium]
MTTQRWSASTLVGQLKHELRQIGLVTLYFFFCFGVVLTLKKLLLADYQIEFYAMSATVVGALVAAKIVVVLDKTRAGTRFDATRPLWLSVLYKTVVYSLAAAAVLSLEKVFHAYREAGQLGQALTEVWMHRDRNVILAKVICVGLAFAGYHLYAGLDRRLGEGTLRRLVMTGRQRGRLGVRSCNPTRSEGDV